MTVMNGSHDRADDARGLDGMRLRSGRCAGRRPVERFGQPSDRYSCCPARSADYPRACLRAAADQWRGWVWYSSAFVIICGDRGGRGYRRVDRDQLVLAAAGHAGVAAGRAAGVVRGRRFGRWLPSRAASCPSVPGRCLTRGPADGTRRIHAVLGDVPLEVVGAVPVEPAGRAVARRGARHRADVGAAALVHGVWGRAPRWPGPRRRSSR